MDNGVDREAPVRIYVMGGGDAHKTAEGRIFVGGHWREEQEWPLARTEYDAVLTCTQTACCRRRSQPSTRRSRTSSIRRNPVPTIGGNVSSQGNADVPGRGAISGAARISGCVPTRSRSRRGTMLWCFRRRRWIADVEVTGRLIVKLWASSDALDTDFTAKLVDVYPPNGDFPNGVDLNVADSIVRARYRNGPGKAELLKPGQPYEFTIEMYPTSLVFRRGHRIRLDISSSNFPRFDVNPNTGEPLNDNRRSQVAENTIYLDAKHPSQIILPVIPEK